jgi:predicted CoA-binding protein
MNDRTAPVRKDCDSELREILETSKTIAVVGIKNRESEDAYRVPKYMQSNGSRIVPINPKVEFVLGERAYDRLDEFEGPIDLVNLFRAVAHIPGHVEEILALELRPKSVWMQLGIYHGTAADKLREAGISVIQDRCIMVEHRRLVGPQELDKG